MSQSLPMWERGLKHKCDLTGESLVLSLPMWERGLKPPACSICLDTTCRSPCGSVD